MVHGKFGWGPWYFKNKIEQNWTKLNKIEQNW
jgi:hypothetical protein